MSKLHLPNLDNVPPAPKGVSSGWHYTVPETGQLFTGSSLSELIHNLAAHYKASGYPQPPDLVRLVEDHICEHMPQACGGEPRAGGAADFARMGWLAGLKHTFTNVLAGTLTIGTWLAKGRKFVEQEQADSRASVCAGCPENVEPQGCTNCNLSTLHEAVRSLIGSRSTAYNDRLKACKVCLCDLRSKVWLPHEALWPHMTEAQKAALPPFCWLIKEATTEQPAATTTTLLSTQVTTINAPPLS